MKSKSLLIVLTLLMGLGAVAGATPPPVYHGQAILGPGLNSGRTAFSQTWNRTLSPDTLYTLTGLYHVEGGYTLTIPAGTVCQADTAATLIIDRDARILAEGTPEQPIVFTSLKLEGQRAPGDWGGVIILGRAPVNKVEPLIEGGIIGGSYGGTDPNDDSGVFKYVRIEYCGYRFQLNNEVNGLTMGGVGAGTEIHHVQVSYSFDDSYEWFGGTVDCHHLVAFGGTDDEFDTDFGYAGDVQFAFGMKDATLWDPTGETNGFESDNDATGTTQTPLTNPHFSNVTLVGPERTDAMVGTLAPGHKFQFSGVLRRNTRCSIYNSVIMGYPWGISLRDALTQASALTDVLQVRNLSLQASVLEPGSATVHDEGRWAGIVTWYNTAAYANTGSAPRNPSALGLTDLSDFNHPNPVPAAGSELIGSADFAAPALAGFTVTTYRGAFDPALPMDQQWTAGWTNFNPQGTAYVTAVEERGPVASPRAALACYPNPFNPSTAISFNVPQSGRVSLKVFDTRGREVASLHDGVLPAGEFQTVFTGENLSSGTYFARLEGRGFSAVQKMQLVK
jgi:hypothetical protein